MTRYWKTTLTVVVLHEDDDPAIYDSLSDLSRIAYNVNEGDCSGQITQVVTEEVSEERMAQLLEEQGSDPEFLENRPVSLVCGDVSDPSQARSIIAQVARDLGPISVLVNNAVVFH